MFDTKEVYASTTGDFSFDFPEAKDALEIMSQLGTKRIVLRCKNHRTEVIAFWPLPPVTQYVWSRVDKENADNSKWNEATNDDSVIFHPDPISFINKMVGHDRLLVQTEAHFQKTFDMTMSFDIKGVENAIEPLRKECNW